MNARAKLQLQRKKRTRRTRSKLFGTAEVPRLAVFRSNQYIYVQLINDAEGKTIAAVSSKTIKDAAKKKKSEQAEMVGKMIAEKAQALKIKRAVFDRRSYRYHGRVKTLAEAVRAAGLTI